MERGDLGWRALAMFKAGFDTAAIAQSVSHSEGKSISEARIYNALAWAREADRNGVQPAQRSNAQ